MRRSSPALFELINGGTIGRRATLAAPPTPATAGTPAPPVAVESARVEDGAEPQVAEQVQANGSDASEASEAPVPVVRPTVLRVRPSAGQAADEPDAAPERPPGRVLERRFSVSMSAMLLAAAGVIALCVLAWSTAYEAGRSEAEAQAARELRLQSGSPVSDPLNSDLPLNTGLVKQSPTTTGAPATAPAPAPPPPTQARASGDPREVGKNYLQLITTDRSEAEGIVKFLVENGVPAFMVPVDRPGSMAKNPARFSVFASHGLTRDEFVARVPARNQLDAEVDRLGKIWKRDHRGSTDFSGKYWNKFTG